MKQIMGAAALLSLATGVAWAQPQHLSGSETLGPMTRDLIHTLGLGSGNDPHVRACPVTDSLCYDGGGSDAGFAASCNAPQTGQGMNPAARLANDSDQDCARANGLHFPGRCEVVRQAITVIANTHFNGALQQIKVTDVGNIFSCAASALFWDQIPGSTRGHRRINKYAPDGFSAATDLFAAKSHGLVNGTVTNFPSAESPRDRFYWRTHFPRCVTEIFGSGADAAMGYIVANDPDAIGFEDLGVVQTGNYSLAICNDLENGCVDADDFKLPTPFNIAHGRYYYSRPMYFNHVVGDGFQLPPDQQALLDAACNEQTSCSVLARYVDNKAFFPALRCTPDDPGPGKASN